MPWRNYLRSKTRQPAFLWRLTLGILMAGALVGYAAQWLPDSVEKGLREPDTTAFNENYDQVQQLVAEGDWSGLWWAIPRSMWLGWLPGPATIAVITGLCWLAFTIQAGQPSSPGGIRWWLALLAVGLGVVSIWPTLFAVYWQEEVWGLEDSKDLIGGLRFYILGVGLREELSKLLLFLPLLPWVLRRGSEREALLVAACVGLGFAMEENVQYFMGNPTNSIGRFLTANFLHMSLTGLTGLALCRGIWHPRERAVEAATYFLMAMIIHGLYDAFITIPVLAEFGLGDFICFILLAYLFFHELRQNWKPRGETISLTATFLTSVSLVAAVTFVYLSILFNFDTALAALGTQAIGGALFVYMFLREVPESLVDV